MSFPPEPMRGELSARALAYNISIAPGKMFSTTASWTSFFRFNTAWGWGEKEEQGVKRLGELIREMLA
ncbi:GntR family transcriptional regulator [Klebsiella oxytoca]|nr:GntR family transcriptional regulator [Klebsiella oxytoca]